MVRPFHCVDEQVGLHCVRRDRISFSLSMAERSCCAEHGILRSQYIFCRVLKQQKIKLYATVESFFLFLRLIGVNSGLY